MARHQRYRGIALFVLLVMFAAACGQKEGVHQVGFAASGQGQEAGGGGEGSGLADSGSFDGADTSEGGDAGTTATGSGSAGTSASGTTASGGGTSSGGGGTSGGGGSGGTSGGSGGGGTTGTAGGGAQPAGGGDTRGITDTEIRIGIHAPLSGAAPLPQASFNSGKDQYWKHVGQVYGRDVVVIIRDDQYNPSRATSVCDDLIQREQVYLLIGGGGTDQISACARTAANQGVPYLSAGVDEALLRQLPNYFALSMSYLQQAPLLVQWVQKNNPPSNNRFGIMRDRTPGFNGVVNAVKEEAEKAGYEVLVHQVQNATSDAQWLQQNQIEVAFPIMAPSTFVQIVRAPGGTIDQWAGIGITMGLNTVANAACRGNPGYSGAMFFSPFPGLNQIDNLDPAFREAGGTDDIQLALWGLNKVIHEVFKNMSANNLSRQAFVQALQSNVIRTNAYPELRHTPDNHFGAQSVHVLVADCSQNVYVTPDDGLFRSGF